MATVYIQDQTYDGSFGRADFQFSMMGCALDHFPPLSVGSAVRINHMIPQGGRQLLIFLTILSKKLLLSQI
jgi:hypothetical protein